jgi:catechol 2,3-dioxygenase-like lactoylglutathione lyase family enzyme
METPLRNLQHVGITVSNLDRTLEFYRNTFGIEPLFRHAGKGPEIDKSLGLPDCEISTAFLDLGNARIELMQFHSSRGRTDNGRWVNDAAVPHICFEVENVEATYKDLSARGVDFVSSPIVLGKEHGPFAGLSYVYLRDPDGVALQLYQLPKKS